MDLRQRFSSFFKYIPNPNQQKEKLPQVMLFGHEKSYGQPQPHDFNRMVSNYKSWPYACANKNGFSVAKCKLKLYRKDADGQPGDEIFEHPFLDLINTVNPFSNRFDLFAITQIFLELTGNAYWFLPKDNLRVPSMIWQIPANWMKIIPSKEMFIEGYVMQVPGSGKAVPFLEEEIVHFKFPSPFNLFYGTGPLLAAAYGIDLNNEIKTWGINFFMNNAQPSGVLQSDSSVSREAYQRLSDSWNRKYRGSKNAGKIAILEEGLKYQQIGSSVKDSKFEDVSKEMRDEILAMFGVPASKLGLVEDVNRANADANDYTYQKETIVPRLALLEEKINEKILPVYDPRLICKFESPVPDDREYRLREKQINIQSGFSSIDEEREKEGLEPFGLPETSAPLIPFSLSPAGAPKPDYFNDPSSSQENDKEDEPKKSIQIKAVEKQRTSKWEAFAILTHPQEKLLGSTISRFFEVQHGDVMRNLNKYKALDAQALKKEVSAFILFNLNEQIDKLTSLTSNNVRNAYVAGLMLGVRDTDSSIDFNLFEPNIINAVKQRVGFFAEKINQSTANLIQEQLTLAFQNGESINEVSRRIDTIYKYSRDYRSKRIAQTEVIGATNDGQLRAYQEAGMEAKEWLSARDERVRSSHQIDGQIVGITESFRTNDGNHLNYPGDRSSGAPAGDVINCRCTVLPVRKKA